MTTVEEIFKPLRENLLPKGNVDITILKLRPGTAVDSKLPQKAIDEIINFSVIGSRLGDIESACMQIAKMVLMDSADL